MSRSTQVRRSRVRLLTSVHSLHDAALRERCERRRWVDQSVTVWRPGVTTLANPGYRFGGPRQTGNIQ